MRLTSVEEHPEMMPDGPFRRDKFIILQKYLHRGNYSVAFDFNFCVWTKR